MEITIQKEHFPPAIGAFEGKKLGKQYMSSEATPNVILIADNQPANLEELSEILHQAGCKVLVANDRESAVNTQPDLILLDVFMPGIDEFQAQLKTNPATQNIPVILISNYTTDKLTYLKLGAVDYITWPFQAEEVLARVNLHLKLSNLSKTVDDLNLQLAKHTEELEKARLEGEIANRAKNEFLSVMSHELRTPMNAVVGMTELLMQTELSLEQFEYADTINRSGHEMLNLINHILNFASIQSNNLMLTKQSFNIRHCIQESLDLVFSKARQKQLTLTSVIPPETPTRVSGYFTPLREILKHLLTNAIKFTEKGKVVLALKTEHLEAGQFKIIFFVKDTGIGISPEEINRLFQPFSQVDSSTTRNYNGTGLSLAICKRLITMMGGKIWVKSTPGAGSTFAFSICVEEVPLTEESPV